MKISDAAKAADLPAKTLRYYHEIGLVSPSAKAENGYRDYAETDLSKLIFIRRARAFGFSIADCRTLLSLYEDRNRSSAEVKKIAQDHVSEIDQKLNELNMLRSELSELVEACQGDHRPDCPIMDRLADVAKD